MQDSLIHLTILAAFIFLLAGFVKGVIGLGLPTVAIGLLGLVMTPVEAVALLVVPSLVTNVWQLATGPGIRPLLHRMWPMLVAICVGTWIGSALLPADGAVRASVWLGAALLLYAIFGLSVKRFSVPSNVESWMSPLIGVVTGGVAAVTGVFVVPAVPYLQALGMNKDELVQALGLSFTVSTLALAAVLVHQGAFHTSVAGASLATLIPALVGMLIGQWIRSRVSAGTFRLCFFVGMLLLGAHLVLRPAF